MITDWKRRGLRLPPIFRCFLNSVLRRRKTSIPCGAGFTLVELLVVIAIIAVLAAMLLPTLQKAKESGNKAVCANNLRQLSLVFNIYADDNNEFFPPVNFSLGQMLETPLGQSWGGWLPTYIANKKILFCPAYDTRVGNASYVGTVYATYWPVSPYYGTTYYLVAGCAVDNAPSISVMNGRQLQVASTPAFPTATCPRRSYCGTYVTGYGLGGDYFGPYWVPPAAEQPLAVDKFEPGVLVSYYGYSGLSRVFNNNHVNANGENIVYVDGHLEWKTAAQVKLRYYGFNGVGGAAAYW